jgi:beta-lactam-binding protein with PASTA domain
VVAVGDFNRDGNLDLAVQSYSGSITILLGNGDGTFGAPTDYNPGGYTGSYTGDASMVLGDFNGDGFLDIATLVTPAPSGYMAVGVLYGNGDGTFQSPVVFPTSANGNSSSLAVGNFHNVVCSEVDLNGHGTNVAGIAAGNGSAGGGGANQTPYRYIGMAPQADLVIVRGTLTDQDIVDGVAYIEQKAKDLGKPAVINLSLGGELGPHDGTSSLDSMLGGLTGPGQIVVAAMGNDGSNPLHADGVLPDGGNLTIGLTVPNKLTTDFKIDIWYPGRDLIGVNVVGPDGLPCLPAPEFPGSGSLDYFQDPACGPGGITANPINAANSDHETMIDLSEGYLSGTWAITLTGAGCGTAPCITQGTFDIWVERPANQPFASLKAFVDQAKSINEPATSTNLVAVASYITKNSWNGRGNTPVQSVVDGALTGSSPFSSLGPRRACSFAANCPAVQKPDLAAPGQMIMSSYAAGSPTASCGIQFGPCLDADGQHITFAGTSQATPHVTGATALLLAQYANMTPCQVKTSLANTRVDGTTGAVIPNTTFGWGKLAIDLAAGLPPAQNNIPNVVNLTLAAAQAALATAGMRAISIAYAGNVLVPLGSVISQSPPPGPGCVAGGVSLVVSGIAVPSVVGDTQAEASAAITAAQLVVGTVTLAGSSTVPVGDAIGTNPAAGTYVAQGSTVGLVMAGIAVPAVTGDTLAAATAAITGVNLTVGSVTPQMSTTVPAGEVSDEQPGAGTFVAAGSPVNLVISGVQVPAVTGQAKAAAEGAISIPGLTVGTVTFAGSQTVAAGNVISEDPAAGTVVLLGSPVNLVISGIAVPNVFGEALSTGESAITVASLTVGNVTLAASATVPGGHIASQTPVAGTYVDIATAVNLTVAGIAIPNVVGEDLNTAEGGITGAGLGVGNVTQAASALVPVGAVMSENPAAGTLVLPSATVDLVVSTGSQGQTQVPNVVGMTQARATTTIQGVGLVVGMVTTAASGTVAAGNVISESPAAGSLVNPGSAVNLVVSTGAALLAITVTPVNPSIMPGATEQFIATGNYGGNATQNLTNQVTWSSTVAGVATISGGGLATAGAVGTSTISATFGQVSASMVLTVTDLAQCATDPHGTFTTADANVMINQALGVSPPADDLKGSGAVNVADVQVAVNAAMGMGCTMH